MVDAEAPSTLGRLSAEATKSVLLKNFCAELVPRKAVAIFQLGIKIAFGVFSVATSRLGIDVIFVQVCPRLGIGMGTFWVSSIPGAGARLGALLA